MRHVKYGIGPKSGPKIYSFLANKRFSRPGLIEPKSSPESKMAMGILAPKISDAANIPSAGDD